MTCKTIFLAASLLATFYASAQRFSLGVRGGFSLSDLNYGGSYAFTFSGAARPLPGFHVGAEGGWQLGERFTLLVGAQYTRKGYRSKLDRAGGGYDDVHYILHYATLPVVGSFRIWKGWALQGGLEAGWLLSSQGKTVQETFDAEGFFDQYRDFDLGVLGGLEYQFSKGFFLGTRYTLGFTPLSSTEITNDNGEKLGTLRLYNGSAQWFAGYRYYFGK